MGAAAPRAGAIASAIGPSQRWQRKRSSRPRRCGAGTPRPGPRAARARASRGAGAARRLRVRLHLGEGALERLGEGDGIGIAAPRIERRGLAQHRAQRRRARSRGSAGSARAATRTATSATARSGSRRRSARARTRPTRSARARRPARARRSRTCPPRCTRGRGRREARGSEVAERGAAVREDHDVLGLHVAVQHALAVRVGEPGATSRITRSAARRAPRARVLGEASLREVGRHHEVAVDPVRVAHRDDVGRRRRVAMRASCSIASRPHSATSRPRRS